MAAANVAAGGSSGGNQSTSQNAMNVSGATSSSTSTVEALAAGLKNIEVISILKRRNNSTENINMNENLKYTSSAVAVEEKAPSIHSQTYSDTSIQRYEDDDDDDDDDDDGSDSDWDGFPVSWQFVERFSLLEH